MNTEIFEGTNKPSERLVFGTGVEAVSGDDEKTAFEVLDGAFEAGFRIFDTANAYSNAEKNLGAWMNKNGVRDSIIILDKGHNTGMKGSSDKFGAKTVREQLYLSLDRLKTDKVDFYLLHRDDERGDISEIVDELDYQVKSGTVLRFGGSNFSWNRMCEANAYAQKSGKCGFSAYSPCYSLAVLERDLWGGSFKISGDENVGIRSELAKNRMPVFAYSSLARGYLSGKYIPDENENIYFRSGELPILEYDSVENRKRLIRARSLAEEKGCTVPQICLAWVLCSKMNVFPIVSPSKRAHIEDNMSAADIILSEEERLWLYSGKNGGNVIENIY